MNDGQLEAQPAANAQEPASKPKFQKTVTLLWTDVIRYLDEIEATSPITKVDVPLEIISLGANLYFGRSKSLDYFSLTHPHFVMVQL